MIKFPRELVDSYFADHYRRGAVIRYKMKCDDPTRAQRYKFGIVLNNDTSEPEALLAITTTKIGWFSSGQFENDIVRLRDGTYSWVTAETIIDLRSLRPETLEDLKLLNVRQEMTFEQELESATMAEVDRKLCASRLIELRTKKRVI
jgi:hypothetical protein